MKEAVLEILHPDGSAEKPASRARQRVDLVLKLKKVIQKKKSWAQVQDLIDDLEKLL